MFRIEAGVFAGKRKELVVVGLLGRKANDERRDLAEAKS